MIDTIYHIGLLAPDRAKDPALDRRASGLMALAEQGKVTLYQRRVAPGRFEYHSRPVKGAV